MRLEKTFVFLAVAGAVLAAPAVTADAEGAFSPAASWIGAKGRFFHYNTRKEMRTAAVYAKDFALAAKPKAAAGSLGGALPSAGRNGTRMMRSGGTFASSGGSGRTGW